MAQNLIIMNTHLKDAENIGQGQQVKVPAVSTSRRTIQGLAVEGLTVGVKSMEHEIKVKVTESRYLRSPYIEKHYARFGGCRPYS